MAAQNQNQGGPKTAFGRFMVYTFIPQYSNNVQGLVYMGAALLIIIVGLRGLGTVAYDIPVVPRFLFDHQTHKIAPMWVMTSLFLEFSLLMVLAIVTFFTPEESSYSEPANSAAATSEELEKIKQTMNELKVLAEEDLKIINGYLQSVENVNKKLVAVKADLFKSLSELKQVFKS